MSRVAIVGVEGSGKTVLMAALADLYGDPSHDSVYLMPESQSSFAFMKHIPHKMREEHQWPAATTIESFKHLKWSMRVGQRVLMDIEMLDYPGELYRMAFGERKEEELESHRDSIHEFLAHLVDADILVVLFNLSDALDLGKNARNTETVWLTRSIFEYAKKLPNLKQHLLLFTQADRHADALSVPGGAKAVMAQHLPMLQMLFPDLECAAVSVATDSGTTPTADFSSTHGISGLMSWLFIQTAEGRTANNGLTQVAETLSKGPSADLSQLDRCLVQLNNLHATHCDLVAPGKREQLHRELSLLLPNALQERCDSLRNRLKRVKSLNDLIFPVNEYSNALRKLKNMTTAASPATSTFQEHQSLCAELETITSALIKSPSPHQFICSEAWKILRSNLSCKITSEMLSQIQLQHIADIVAACNVHRDKIAAVSPSDMVTPLKKVTGSLESYKKSVAELADLRNAFPESVGEALTKEHQILCEDLGCLVNSVNKLLESHSHFSLKKESFWLPIYKKLNSDIAKSLLKKVQSMNLAKSREALLSFWIIVGFFSVIAVVFAFGILADHFQEKKAEEKARIEKMEAEERTRQKQADEAECLRIAQEAEAENFRIAQETAAENIRIAQEAAVERARQEQAAAEIARQKLAAVEKASRAREELERAAAEERRIRTQKAAEERRILVQKNEEERRIRIQEAEEEHRIRIQEAAAESIRREKAAVEKAKHDRAELERRAAANDPGAEWELGCILSKTSSTTGRVGYRGEPAVSEMNQLAAWIWWRRAAEHGHLDAQIKMGEASSGNEQIHWYTLAAEQKSHIAATRLGRINEEKAGDDYYDTLADKYRNESLKWYSFASIHGGGAEAQSNVERMRSKLSRSKVFP